MKYLPERFVTLYGLDGFTVEVDPPNRILRINGVRFTFEIFEHLANPDPSKLFSFTRDGETVTVTTHG